MYTAIPGQPPIELVAYYKQFSSYYPNCELPTKRWFVEHVQPDWIIFDCGANIGYYTILFSRLAPQGHVYAFEPTETFAMLKQNLAHHQVKNVSALRLAVGDKCGLHVDGIFRLWGQDPERQEYAFTTIDHFVQERGLARIDCIKIDVDSYDFEVLRGAAAVLERFDPYVVVELNHALNKRNQSAAGALEWLAQHGYREAICIEHENFLLKRDRSFRGARPLPTIQLQFSDDGAIEITKDASSASLETKNNPPSQTLLPDSIDISAIPVNELHTRLGIVIPLQYPTSSLHKPLGQWRMEEDDAPIFRYLYRNFRPKRHLEFGTWQGRGVTYVLEECDATVWTLNLLAGERNRNGNGEYGIPPEERDSALAWARQMGLPMQANYTTDSLGFIGRYYLERHLGHRVCQIYCDSREWDTSAYPSAFFDTVLIDGGHQRDVVISDTRKAMPLLRSGGLMLWHDFCPPVFQQFEATRGVMQAIYLLWPELQVQMQDLFWVQPSWILVGVKR